ncbi:MAG: RsmD family RNA methyltransferase [bacterium]|nr:RsmD family RNA methyltransferase [bacterium]
MRVVAGRWRGRRLLPPPDEAIRPTADRVKEALFSILGRRVEGAVFVDLCCGSGALGIEALSRGGARSVFVDDAPAALALAGRNLARCGADPGSYTLEAGDAIAWLERWRPGPGTPWVLVTDPPYRGPVAERILGLLRAGAPWPGCRALVVECASVDGSAVPEPEGWQRRRYGQASLALWLDPAGD